MWSRPLARLLATYLVVLAGLRLTIAAPEACTPVTAEQARSSAAGAADWMAANQKPDGTYVYEARRDGSEVGDYNIVRHAGVTLALYMAAAHLDRDAYLSAAERGLGWMLDQHVSRHGWTAPADARGVPLGAAALMLAGLVERRLLTGDTTHDDLARAYGRFLVAMQRDDGGCSTVWWLDVDERDPTDTSPYFPGEATWALARLANLFPDEPGWRVAAQRGATFIATERDEAEGVPVPPLNDHWYAYAAAEMATWPLTDEQAHYARMVHGRFDLLIRFEAQREAGTVYALTHGPARRSAAVGTWVEGEAAFAKLAGVDDRLADLRDDITRAARCGAGVLAGRQVQGEGPAVDGAWFSKGLTRMDDQQHAVSGLIHTALVVEGTE